MTATSAEEPSSYPPPAEFIEQANARAELYREAEEDRLAFWAKQADRLSWATPFGEVLDWSDAPFANWFVGGKLNVAYNCVDRHVEAGNGDRVAIHWVGEPIEDSRTLTYADLQAEVSKAANALTGLGLVAGDRVAIYLPLIPEAVIAMLACARLGIMHSVVFGGFTANTLHARIVDAQAKLLITSDGQFRRGHPAPLKDAADEAVSQPDSPVEHVLVVRRTGIDVSWNDERDLWWHDVVDSASPQHTPEPFDAEQPLFLLYTSGTTGKTPRGPRASPRASCTPAAATSPSAVTRCTPSSTSSPRPTCSGAPPTSAGSPATPMACTVRWPTASPRSSTRAHPIRPTNTVTSRSSKNTVSQSITPPRR